MKRLEIDLGLKTDIFSLRAFKPQGWDSSYSGVHGITAKTGGRYTSVLTSFDKLDI